ncbi:hypothetical protein SADUNF_Sadunf02G0174400 [Salix dunnii]|uniref:Uncharacterized protein n=1 Tax=Salix dunnii TaxID=1413687 RepID=A0A835TKP9_9ROSI|nr:hypothetical protein SADUNF_Sadunf02G0174400 [Salix dunnii]
MAHVSDIKLIRTDTTLDLSQKAEKGMPIIVSRFSFYRLRPHDTFGSFSMWDIIPWNCNTSSGQQQPPANLSSRCEREHAPVSQRKSKVV